MKDIRIFKIIALFHPYIGGAEKQALKLAQELNNKSIQVTVVTGRWTNALKKNESYKGIKIIRNLTNLKFWGNSPEHIKTDFFKPEQSIGNVRFRSIRILIRKIFIRTSIYIYQVSLLSYLIRNRKYYEDSR